MTDMTGKVALVTGGGSGIGRATALEFAGRGAAVMVADFNLEGAQETARQIGAAGGRAAAVKVDVADEASVKAMVAEAMAAFGRLDYLVNNAGTPVSREPVPFADLDRIDEEFWEKIFQTNLWGMFRCIRAAAPHLKKTRGAVVNLASIAGFSIGAGSSLPYAASKAGVVNLTRNLSIALAPEVRVNAVAPGLVDTPWTQVWPQGRKDGSVARTALGRMATPRDIAEVILFFCAGADFVTGQTLLCDGGRV